MRHYGSLTEDKDKAGSAKVNKSGHVKKVTVTTNKKIQAVLIQPGGGRRSIGHKINSQIECTIIRKIHPSLEMFKTFYSTPDRRNDPFLL